MSDDPKRECKIETQGGSYTEGDVNTGGDFVNRDKIVQNVNLVFPTASPSLKKRDQNLQQLEKLFDEYLQKIVTTFEEQRSEFSGDPHRDLLDFYIEVKGARTPPSKGDLTAGKAQDLWEAMLPSLQKGDPHLVLGEFGMGKTWLSRMILYRLAKEASKAALIPLWISLSGFRPTSLDLLGLSALLGGIENISESIFSQLRRQAWVKAIGENATSSFQEELIELYEAGRFLFLLDGLDEVALGGRDITALITADIGKLSTHAKRSPILLTCRRSFFTDQAQENNLKLLFHVFYVWPWSHADISQYLTKAWRLGVLKNEPQSVLEKLEQIHGLEDVSGRAMVSAMLVDQWDTLINKDVIDLPGLYDRHIHKALLNWQAGKTHRLQEHELRAWMEEVAFLMFRLDSYSLTPEDLDEYFSGKFDQFRIERFSQLAESMTRDIKTNSLLVREENKYSFCHLSVWEYLVAQKLLHALEKDPSAFRVPSRSVQYRSIVSNFLVPMLFQQGKQHLVSSLMTKTNSP